MKNKLLKIAGCIAAILAVVLAVNLIGPYINNADDTERTQYVSEMKLFYGDTAAEAKSACESAGYICQEKDLNSGTEKKYVYLGYKLTYDRDEAITDVHMLEMNNGYEMQDYSTVAETAADNASVTVSEFLTSAREFKQNYSAGSPAAKAALEMLNLVYIPEENNVSLGDYIISDSCSESVLKKIFTMSTAAVITLMFSAMVAGVADYNSEKPEENWASRVNNEVIQRLADGETATLDTMYLKYAKEIKDQVVSFAEKYDKAYAAAQSKSAPVDTEQLAEDIVEEGSEELEKLSEEDITEESDYAVVLLAYDELNKYTYNGETPLGEWLVSVGKGSFDDNASYRVLYPLAEALTVGQVATMKMNGIVQMAMYLNNTSDISSVANDKVKDAQNVISQYNGQDKLSVWEGADTSMYDQKIALTSEAVRARSAGYQFDKYTATDKFEEGLSDALKYIGIVSGAISVAWGITVIGFSFYAGTITMATSGLMAIAGQLIAGSTLSAICGVVGGAFVVLNILAVVVLVLVIVIFLVYELVKWLSITDAEDYTDVPGYIYDLKNSKYIKYSLVEGGSDGEFSMDLNGGKNEGKRWNVLYYTKNEAAGDPLVANSNGEIFQVQYNNSTTPDGYEAVTTFGSVSPANMNANVRKDGASGIYMFFTRTGADAPSSGETQPSEGEKTDTKTTATYISSILLDTQASESAAKNSLKEKGYQVIDLNLSGVSGKYCYIGYQTTTNPDSAIRDIRVAPESTDSAVLYGCGSYANCGTTPSGDSVYYTRSTDLGTPILSLQATDKLSDAGYGFEPVNPFSGGQAYNLAKSFDTNGLKRYLFFEPETKYTSGTKYLGGLTIVSEQTTSQNKNTLRFSSALNMSKLSYISLTDGYVIKSYDDSAYSADQNLDTYVYYSETYNPYRAIYGVASYTTEPSNTSLFTSLGSTSGRGGYVQLTNYYESGKNASRNESYIGVSFEGGYLPGEGRLSSNLDEAEGYSWSSSTVRVKNLYVKGRMKDEEPLTSSDIQLSTKNWAPNGYTSIQDLKTPYYSGSYNIAYYYQNGDKTDGSPVYMYISKQTTKKQYISSITVCSYDLEAFMGNSYKSADDDTKELYKKMANDLCFNQLLASCSDEIILSNLAEKQSDSLMGKNSDYTTNSAYIGVTRTDKSTAAITGIIKYKPQNGTAPSQITVNGTTYTRAGTAKLGKIKDSNGTYYLYYTTEISSNLGIPITEIAVDDVPIIEGYSTSLTATAVDTTSGKASPAADLKDKNYVHAKYDTTAGYIQAIYIGHGETRNQALEDLLTQGCTQAVTVDLNYNAKGEYVYIGYSKYMPNANEKTPKYAVYDIIYTVGEPHQKSITVNGVKYSCALESAQKQAGYDGSQGTSLNIGNDGEEIYVYFTRKQTAQIKSPIVNICAISGDGTPEASRGNWEMIVDVNGNKVNLNEGIISKDPDGRYVKDCRVYTAVVREDGSVKEGAAFTGSGSLTLVTGQLYTSN